MAQKNKSENKKPSQGKVTINHGEIKRWVEKRSGAPAVVRETGGDGEGGILRIDFGEKEESLEPISWEEFFEIFEDKNLAFLYQEETADGSTSRFFKFVEREDNMTDDMDEEEEEEE